MLKTEDFNISIERGEVIQLNLFTLQLLTTKEMKKPKIKNLLSNKFMTI